MMCITRMKWNTSINILQMLIFQSFNASGLAFSRYTNDYWSQLKKEQSLYDI